MEVLAKTQQLRSSPQKMQLILNTVRGKKVSDALNILQYLASPHAKEVAKIVKAASANAENNFNLSSANLVILKAWANQGRTLKRFRPRSRGRVSPIIKHSTHITVIVGEA